jgi:hypothetical protein
MNETEQKIVSNGKETELGISETFFNKIVGISEAASITGRSKGQIGRDSNTKRLVYTLDDKGQKRYKVADLFNLYGFKRPGEMVSQEEKRPIEIATETAVEIAVLKSELKAKEDALRRIEEEVRDLRQSRDRLLDQNNRLTMLLPAPSAPPSAPLVVNEPERRPEPSKRPPFWKRLFS